MNSLGGEWVGQQEPCQVSLSVRRRPDRVKHMDVHQWGVHTVMLYGAQRPRYCVRPVHPHSRLTDFNLKDFGLSKESEMPDAPGKTPGKIFRSDFSEGDSASGDSRNYGKSRV